MNATFFLRSASIVSLLLAAGHTLGARKSWSPVPENDVLAAMKSFHFDAMGANRTYHEFYIGFGFSISVYLFLQAVLLWQLASIWKSSPSVVRPLVASLFLASLACTVVAWVYIMIVPVVFSAVITVLIGAAFFFPVRS